ncbi:hypothetical protein DPMN_088326 [Dreissena polymorpha]|uniref:Uncharacterized protein n=1 Tax=Dreissena polymorpha TaxID=45954 RepID=A0A9D4QXS3_DREPO|nr:hypothetical protein DPMN_088326 [Dreissena polymorpha]
MNNKWPHGRNVFQQTGTIFELVQDIFGTNLLKKFYEDPTINVASTVLTRQIFMTHNGRQTIDKRLITCFHYIHIEKTAPPPGGHVFPPIWTIFEFNLFTCFYYIHIEKNAPNPGGNVFSSIWTIFELVRDINETNVLTKFHDLNTAPPTGGHVFQRTGTIFELNQHII